MNADTRYGYRAWDRRPGDNVDPSALLSPEGLVMEAGYTQPQPPMSQPGPRLSGMERTQPSIVDVLGVSLPTQIQQKDMGQAGTLRPSTANG